MNGSDTQAVTVLTASATLVPRSPMKKSVKAPKRATPKSRKPARRRATPGHVLKTLPVAMTGRASPAKAADGDRPVFAYISSLSQPQRSIAERVDALAAKTLPNLQRSVKWGMAWYGVATAGASVAAASPATSSSRSDAAPH